MDALPKPGDRVTHTIFDEGTVKSLRKVPGGTTVLIKFDRYGSKELLWSFCSSKLALIPPTIKAP